MKNKKILFLIYAFVLIIPTSCKKVFLDKQPLSEITPEDYLFSEDQLSSYAIAQYSVLPTFPKGGYGTFGNDINTDNMAYMTYSNRFIPSQNLVPATGGDWSFTDIYQDNYFLEKVLPRFNASQITGNITNIKQYIGEIYFLRAWNYFAKLQQFGDFPIIKTTLPNESDPLIAASKRAPQNEVARFIISDLDSAIYYMLPVFPGNTRLSGLCAQLLKSRVALYEGTWLKDFEGTAFVPNGPGWPGATKDYNKNYAFPSGSIDGEIDYFLKEAIASAKIVADAVPLTQNSMTDETQTSPMDFAVASAANPYFAMFGSVDLSKYPEALLWRQYNPGLGLGNNAVLYAEGGNYASGETRGMVDGFLMKNGLPIYASASGYAGDDSIAEVRENRDGRLWLFLKQPGQINVLKTAAVPAPYPIEPIPNILASSFENNYSTGYTIRKGLNYDAAQVQVYYGGSTASIAFRAVEAYLNYIEASYLENGIIDATASSYWKEIRNRAGVDPDFQKTIDATDLSKEALNDWGVYTGGKMVDKTSYNIRRERRCELMAEGLRYMDLRRWRSMDQMITTPYHIEGFKIWGPMQYWYPAGSLTYDVGDASTVSSPSRSQYLRPYEKTTNSLVYNGYSWNMALYLEPISTQQFLNTSDNGDLTTSPIYQNPGWSTTANSPPTP